jgi:hypothetical protein
MALVILLSRLAINITERLFRAGLKSSTAIFKATLFDKMSAGKPQMPLF